MKTAIKSVLLAAAGTVLWGAEISGGEVPRVAFVAEAQAIIGRPMTPVSYAGVARRTTRRVVAADAAVVTTAAVATTAAAANAAAYPPPQPYYAPPPPPPQGVPVGTVVSSLPPGCTPVNIGGVDYQLCNGTYYRAGFSGANVVYVVERP